VCAQRLQCWLPLYQYRCRPLNSLPAFRPACMPACLPPGWPTRCLITLPAQPLLCAALLPACPACSDAFAGICGLSSNSGSADTNTGSADTSPPHRMRRGLLLTDQSRRNRSVKCGTAVVVKAWRHGGRNEQRQDSRGGAKRERASRTGAKRREAAAAAAVRVSTVKTAKPATSAGLGRQAGSDNNPPRRELISAPAS